jgi:multimeric flavodoxin WrbA
MFTVLAVSGSPRKGGNTEILLKTALEPLARAGHKTQAFFLSQKKVAPCRACDKCLKKGRCIVKDDFQELYQMVDSCDALLVGSPVYMRNVSAQLKAVFDRFHCAHHSQPFRGKLGGALAVGGAPNSQGIVLGAIHNFFLSFGMYCVPGHVNGVSVVAREKAEVLRQPASLAEARELGDNILALLSKIKPEELR